MSDTVPDVSPVQDPVAKPATSSPNVSVWFMLVICLYLIYHRLGWESVVLLTNRIDPQYVGYLKMLWLLPVLGIFISLVSPSPASMTLWVVGSTIFTSLPIGLASLYVLLFGNRTDPSE